MQFTLCGKLGRMLHCMVVRCIVVLCTGILRQIEKNCPMLHSVHFVYNRAHRSGRANKHRSVLRFAHRCHTQKRKGSPAFWRQRRGNGRNRSRQIVVQLPEVRVPPYHKPAIAQCFPLHLEGITRNPTVSNASSGTPHPPGREIK